MGFEPVTSQPSNPMRSVDTEDSSDEILDTNVAQQGRGRLTLPLFLTNHKNTEMSEEQNNSEAEETGSSHCMILEEGLHFHSF